MGTILVARTEVVGMRRVFARRRGAFRLPGGNLAASVNTDWVLIDGRGALTRISAVFTEMFGGTGEDISISRVSLPPTPVTATRTELSVRPMDLDPMGHANNAVYLDWVEEAIAAAGGAANVQAFPRRYRLEYALAATPGPRSTPSRGRTDAGWSVRLTNRELRSDLFRGRLERADRPEDATEGTP